MVIGFIDFLNGLATTGVGTAPHGFFGTRDARRKLGDGGSPMGMHGRRFEQAE